MSYKTYLPSSELEPFVKCYWTLQLPSEEHPQRQVIVPDGCMEMIFHFGDPYFQYISNEEKIQQPYYFVFGQITKTLEIEASGTTDIFSVRFQPEGFLPFANGPIEEMENKAVPLKSIFGSEILELIENICSAEHSDQRISCIETFLLDKLNSSDLSHKIARDSVALLIQSRGQLSVHELSDQMSVHRRNLERKFARAIGLSPKQLAKIIRLQAALKMLHEGNFENLTSLAYQNGYFDQAHFIRDFKEFTGYSPRQFYADSLKMSTLFVGSE